MNFIDFLKHTFLEPRPASPEDLSPEEALQINFKTVVVEFADNVESSGGETVVSILKNCEGISVSYFDEPLNKTFLNLDGRTFFDLIDKGQSILDRMQADVLIWGCREGDKLRLNFQTSSQYGKSAANFVSPLDCLYFPADFFITPLNFPQSLGTLIYGSVISAIVPANRQKQIQRRYLLKKIIANLSSDNSAKFLSIDYLPYVMNFLGLIYLSYSYESENDKDFKIVRNLLENAIKHQDLIKNPLHLGCIYNHLGQLYDTAALHQPRRHAAYCKGAINNYRLSQKYIGKYTYPYDYGMISYKLSHLFYDYWKQKEDIQALRDSVFNLREAEKIFTYALFPDFWADIQGELGHVLSVLGRLTGNDTISELALAAHKNRQKIITERRDPLLWASIQEDIGGIYSFLGQKNDDTDSLEEALDCYHDALYIFENMQRQEDIKRLTTDIAKTSKLLNE